MRKKNKQMIFCIGEIILNTSIKIIVCYTAGLEEHSQNHYTVL